MQRPTIRNIIHDAIDELRALLVIREAFPNGITTVCYIRHALNTAAEKRCPIASSIHKRLLGDEDYGFKLIPLASPFLLRFQKHKLMFVRSCVLGSPYFAARSRNVAT